MLKIQHWSHSLNKVGIITTAIAPVMGMALMTATTAPAFAQVLIEGGGFYYGVNQPTTPFIYQSPNVAPFVYGSPIPTPVPVNPSTGLPPRTTYYTYPARTYYDYPVRSRVEGSTLIDPVLVNPRIKNSTLVNPVIVDDPVYHPRVKYRRSVRVRSLN